MKSPSRIRLSSMMVAREESCAALCSFYRAESLKREHDASRKTRPWLPGYACCAISEKEDGTIEILGYEKNGQRDLKGSYKGTNCDLSFCPGLTSPNQVSMSNRILARLSPKMAHDVRSACCSMAAQDAIAGSTRSRAPPEVVEPWEIPSSQGKRSPGFGMPRLASPFLSS